MDNVLRQIQEAIGGILRVGTKRLQRRLVSEKAPTANDLLGWDATNKWWEPKSSVPAARAYNSGALSHTSTSNWQNLSAFDSERFDTDTIHDASTNNERLTATTAGKYLIWGNFAFAGNAGGDRRGIAIVLNDTTMIAADLRAEPTGAICSLSTSTVYDLGATDYVTLQGWQDSGGNLAINAGSAYSPEFGMIRLGPTGSAVGAAGDSHGDLSDLTGPDDHTQYLLNTGTRAGSTGQAQDFGSTGIKADVLAESTGAAGVTGDGVKLKDGSVVIANAGYIGSVGDTDAMQIEADGDVVFSQDVVAAGTLASVGNLTTLATLLTDTITEQTGDAGVTVEGVQVEDGVITFTAATGVSIIGFPDNLADALSFEEGGTAYLTFVTTNASEKVAFGKAVTVSTTLGVTGVTTATGGVVSGSNIESDTDDTDDLGTTSKRWGNLHLGHDVKLDSTPDADHETSGITAVFTANENQAFGDVCYIDGDSEMHLADADAIATSKVVGMCADATIAADASGDYLLFGIANHADGWAWTVGGYVFLTVTGTTTNTLSQTAPTGADDCVVIVGVATHADRILFNPQTVIVEHTG